MFTMGLWCGLHGATYSSLPAETKRQKMVLSFRAPDEKVPQCSFRLTLVYLVSYSKFLFFIPYFFLKKKKVNNLT